MKRYVVAFLAGLGFVLVLINWIVNPLGELLVLPSKLKELSDKRDE